MGDAKNCCFGIGGGMGRTGDGVDSWLLLWRLTVAVHGGWGGGTRHLRSTTETCYVAGGCVRGKNPFLRHPFFFSSSLVEEILFTL